MAGAVGRPGRISVERILQVSMTEMQNMGARWASMKGRSLQLQAAEQGGGMLLVCVCVCVCVLAGDAIVVMQCTALTLSSPD